MPIISVIIPVYNVEKYLRECLNSIVNQTLKDMEIILVNDCSPDNSEQIIFEYAAQDPRIVYLKHTVNLGLGGARNTGIAAAKGKYLAFVDSDDWVKPKCYQKIVSLMEKHRANLGIFSAMKFDDENGKRFYDAYFDIPFSKPGRITVSNIPSVAASAWNKVYKTSDIRTNHIDFPEHIKHEDEEFWLKYASKVQPLAVADPNPYYQYRQRKGSIIADFSLSRKDIPQVFINVYRYWKKEGLLDAYQSSIYPLFAKSFEWYLDIKPAGRPKFASDMSVVFTHFGISMEKAFMLKPQLILFYIEDKKLQECVQQMGIERENKWFRFWQLGGKQKIIKMTAVLLKKMGVYHMIYPICLKFTKR